MTTAKNEPLPTARTLNLKATAAFLGVSPGTIYNMRRDPKRNFPPAVPLGLRGSRYNVEDLQLYAQWGPLWDQKKRPS